MIVRNGANNALHLIDECNYRVWLTNFSNEDLFKELYVYIKHIV